LALIRRSTSLRHTIGEIIHAPQLLYRSIILFYTWSVILAVYLGIGMGIAGNLDSYMHPHRVFVAAAIFEFLSILTCHVILDRFGRKNTLVTCMAFTCVYTYLIPINLAHQTPYISMAFYFAAKFTIGAAQLTCMIYTSEVYPTRMRSTGLGLSAAVARIGGVWAPQINVLSTSLGSMHIPFYIFSLMSFVAALGCLFLPETQNKNLPENVGDAKKLNN
jgi:MFS family permease